MDTVTDHDITHVLGRNFDSDNCPECAAMLERLIKNAERWARQAEELPVD